MERKTNRAEKILEKIEGAIYLTILLLWVFLIALFATNANAEYIDDANHPPYATNKLITLGTFTGNRFRYTLEGGDPDGDDIYFIIPSDQDNFLVNNKIYCEIFHANQLVCEIDENKYISPSSQCVMKDDFIVNECETVEFTYYVQDEGGMRSKKSYTVRLYIAKPQDGSNKTDIRTNARGFFFEAQDRALGNEYGLSAYSKNPAESLMDTDLFDRTKSLGKQFSVARDLMNTNDPDALTNTDLISNTQATAALDGASVSLNANTGGEDDFVTNTITDTLEKLGVNALLTTEKSCLIERLGMKTQSYYYCPWIDGSPKFIAENATAQLKQQQACQDICHNSTDCSPLTRKAYADFVIDRNFLDDTMYISAEKGATAISYANKIYLIKKQPDGTIISSKTIDTSLNTSDIAWDTSIIPSSKNINSELTLKTKFMTDDKFTKTTSGDTFILRPTISYYAVVDGDEVLNSYDATTLFSIKFSNEATKYQCPLPLLNGNIYDDKPTCKNACIEQHDCLYKIDSAEEVDGFGSVKNYCKDIEVVINSVTKTLEQAVTDGDCKLKDEIAIDDFQNPVAEYIKNGMPGKDYAMRPDIGFEEGEAVLFKERAAEIAYAFNDMLLHGKEQGRFDETDKLDNELFRDFFWQKSDNLFATLPIVTGENFANMNINLIIKLNEAYFDKYRYLTKSYSELNADFERDVYESFRETLQLPLWVKFLDYYDIDETIFNKENFKQKLFETNVQQNNKNTVGIVVGLLDVDIPIAYNESTSTHIEFKILDNNQEFRTVSIVPTFPLDENNESQMIVYTEYLRAAGREVPNYFKLIEWADYVEQHNLSTEGLRSIFETTIDSNSININSYADYLTTIAKTSLNDMLTNYALAHNGVFNPNTISFETTSNPTYEATPMIINKDVYESNVTSTYTFLKTYYNDQSLISMPLKITTNALSPTSLYTHQYRYLFVYVDKVENLKSLTVKELMDKFYEDYKSGEKKYFVWDFKDKDRAVKKLSDTVTAWHDTESLNYYGRYFTVDSFSYLDSSDIVSTFYEDITNTQKDGVYIAKRGDSYIVKMNASGEKVIFGGSACPDDKPYDPATKKCTYRTATNDIQSEAASCPDETWQIDAAGNCFKIDRELSNAYNKNGYYFLYLEKENYTNIDFLTPIVNVSPIKCKKQSIKCSLNDVIYNSQDSCQKYCKTATETELAYGDCEDISSDSLPDLISDDFYKLETCSSKCYKEEQKSLDYIKVRLRIGDDVATQKGNIEIKKYLRDGSAVDYSDQIIIEPVSGNIYLSETNDGINMGVLMKNNQITIKYTTSFNGNWYTIGLGRVNDDYLSNPRNIIPGYILYGGNYESCANMSAYYPDMGLYLDIDKDDDGIYEDSIKLSETFVCYSYNMHTLTQDITFDGNKIEYDYIDDLGYVTKKSKGIFIKDYGICNVNTDQINQVPLSRSFLTSEYIPYTAPIEVISPDDPDNPIKATVKFARKPFVSNFGKITRDMTAFFNYLKNPGKYAEDWRNAINNIKNIPIPFYEGVYAIDDFDIMLENTNLDYFFQSNVADYKLKGGFGFVPWNQCKIFRGEKTTAAYVYVDKTNCTDYYGYWYDSSIKKCVGDKMYGSSTDNFYCPHETLNTVSDKCEATPKCQDGYQEDPANPDRCYKTIYTTEQTNITVCKPWWRILRTYECNNVGNAFDYSNFITVGPPRWVEVCDPNSIVKLYKNLAIDEDGNIVDASEVIKSDGMEP